MAQDPGVTESDRFAALRHQMVERQVRRRGIDDDRILAAMETVPRHAFVSSDLWDSAYEDRPLPIGDGQTISQPFIIARMAQLADIQPEDRVLEIGAGCGYAAAVFGQLGREVVTVEIRPPLAALARQTLADLGYPNITVVTGDADGIDRQEKFDAVLAAAAASAIPEPLEARLADRGRLVIPVGGPFSQRLWMVQRRGEELIRRRHEAVAFVPLL